MQTAAARPSRRRRTALRAALRHLAGEIARPGPRSRCPSPRASTAAPSCRSRGRTSAAHAAASSVWSPWRGAAASASTWSGSFPGTTASLPSSGWPRPNRPSSSPSTLAVRALAATRCWTRKEAVLKGRGSGLHGPLAELVVGTAEGPVLVAGWLVVPVPVPAGHVAALATRSLPDVPAAPAAAERSPRGRDVA